MHPLAAFVLALGVGFSSSAAHAGEPIPKAWSAGAALRLAPFEGYPRVGLGLVGAHTLGAFGPRWHVGAGVDLYAPRTRGDVTRFATGLNVHLRLAIVRGERVRWYVLGGVALGVLRDDYADRSVFADVTAVGAGVVLATGLEVSLTPEVSVFAEPRAVSYRTKSAVDDEWLDFGLGARFHF